ncbi:hypothetical protein GCM10017653_34030 [Ancylobacter defluvii]|uniref:Uncharacterized protein n=1 Tax=Ancylobacter defluvii TaxID=1282440 RepID=A0A9W6NC21_9HYPH|nr:hypothetical protein GCM10017653_34030 [Ancylobacter defluvii]
MAAASKPEAFMSFMGWSPAWLSRPVVSVAKPAGSVKCGRWRRGRDGAVARSQMAADAVIPICRRATHWLTASKRAISI